mmetsp:Transcript_18372/g.47044  ORF Transcript_18372/g.47044 Transcript_18372/m.47044 type:complete len:244 (-) Transcript_18372:152-883(-)
MMLGVARSRKVKSGKLGTGIGDAARGSDGSGGCGGSGGGAGVGGGSSGGGSDDGVSRPTPSAAGIRERSSSRGTLGAGAATKIDASLFGNANDGFNAGRAQAPTARAAVLARLKDQESREARLRSGAGAGRTGGACSGVSAGRRASTEAPGHAMASAGAGMASATAKQGGSGGGSGVGGGFFGFGRKAKAKADGAPATEMPNGRGGVPAAAEPSPAGGAGEVAPEDEADSAPAVDAAMLTMRL